jgi:hypothetical protein
MNPDSLREYAEYVRNERRMDIAERLDEFADQWRLQYDEWRSLGRRLAEAKGMADEWERQYDALRERLEQAAGLLRQRRALMHSDQATAKGWGLFDNEVDAFLASLPEVTP